MTWALSAVELFAKHVLGPVVSWLKKRRQRPRIAEPHYSEVESVYFVDSSGPRPPRYVTVTIENIGRSPLHIRRVSLSWGGACSDGLPCRFRVDLDPSRDDPLLPRKPIDEDEPDPPWRRRYYFRTSDPRALATMLKSAAEADLSTFELAVWTEEDEEKPIWHGRGKVLAKLHFLIRERWRILQDVQCTR